MSAQSLGFEPTDYIINEVKMRKIIIVIASLMLVAGISLLLFEPVSNTINKGKAEKITEEFEQTVEAVQNNAKNKKSNNKSSAGSSQQGASSDYSIPTPEQLEKLLKASKKYNEKIFSNQGTVNTSDYSAAAINLKKYGISNNMYAYVSAPSIGMKLPVYLGANSSVMNYGAAHLNNTSLPIKGENVNSVIAAHTGYIGRVFFDNIKHLKKGASVSVRNYWGTINYKVIKTHQVADNDTSDIYIRPHRQLLTLVTCVYREKNKFDRYIVVCERK